MNSPPEPGGTPSFQLQQRPPHLRLSWRRSARRTVTKPGTLARRIHVPLGRPEIHTCRRHQSHTVSCHRVLLFGHQELRHRRCQTPVTGGAAGTRLAVTDRIERLDSPVAGKQAWRQRCSRIAVGRPRETSRDIH